MGWRIPWSLCPTNGVLQGLIIGLVVCQVWSIEVSTSSEVEAVNGSIATLSCSFRTSTHVSKLVSVDWSYRPQSGGPVHSFFYYSGIAHVPEQGQFKGRVRWIGNPSRGDASIQLLNASLTDNGTYTCSVKNPPDVHGAPSQLYLAVVPKPLAVRFTDVAVLMGLVLLPSIIIAPILLARMWCYCKPCGVQRPTPASSPIEIKERQAAIGQYPPVKEKHVSCCELYCQDSDFEDEFYIHNESSQGGGTVAETEC